MRFKQINPIHFKKKYRSYSPSAMTNAYQMVKDNKMSVKKASKMYRVPQTTLRDRVLGKVDPETAVFGKSPLLDCYEEAILVKHFKTMASYGYGYTRQECLNIASDYSVHVGKRSSDKPLTMKWMRGFLKRWPELRVLKPRGLDHARAKMASQTLVNEYFTNLRATLYRHGLYDKPHLIFNVDEKGITIDHTPPYIVADSSYCPQSVTSGKGKTVTILGGGSASGVAIPPFFIFPGKRMRPELMEGATPGAYGTVSETGWSNGAIFRLYLENHFLKHVPIQDDQKILLLLDGHRSHVSVNLVEWARQRGIILFVLPAHTSHLLQPMDVACYGPFQKVYNNQCHKFMRETSSTISRYNICKMACSVYLKTLTPQNIQSGFRRSGIYPLNQDAIPSEYLKPSEVFQAAQDEDSQSSEATVEGGVRVNEQVTDYVECLEEKENRLKKIKSAKKKNVRKTMSKLVSGKEITQTIQLLMTDHENRQKKTIKQTHVVDSKTQDVGLKKAQTKGKPPKSSVKGKIIKKTIEQPGPSAINIQSSDSESDESEIDPSELCCKCNKFHPEEMRRCTSLMFVKWAQCTVCSHWVHLIFCTPVRVVRLGDEFLCHHCKKEE